VKFRHVVPIALLCGVLAGAMHVRAQMWSPWVKGTPAAAGGGGGPFVAGPHTAIAGSGTAACGPTTPINTAAAPAAKLIVVYVANYAASTGTNVLSDSLSNTWGTPDISYDPSNGGLKLLVYHVYAPAVGASHTFTFTGNYCALFVAAFSGGSATPGVDQKNTSVSAGGISWSNAAATPGAANELVVVGTEFGTAAGTINSIDQSFTIIDTVPYVSSATSYGGSFAYLIETTAGPVNPVWQASVAQTPAATMIATYK
jgi:hypothetical protein